MNRPLLIIISGLSASGKTTLGKKLSEKYEMPLISKDGIKETIFDNMGWSDREWSKKVGRASSKLIFYFLNTFLISKKPLIIESNFLADLDSKPIRELTNKFGYKTLQVLCQCDGEILYKRFLERSAGQKRHPGHNDLTNVEEFKSVLLKGKTELLDVDGEVIELNTENFKSIDYDGLYKKIEDLIF